MAKKYGSSNMFLKDEKLKDTMKKSNDKYLNYMYERSGLLKDNKSNHKYDLYTDTAKSKNKFIENSFEKFEKNYTLKNIIRFILLNNKPYNVIKQILILNFVLLGVIFFALIPNLLATIKNMDNLPILIIHSIFLIVYYFILTKYTYNSYFINKLYKDDLIVLFSNKEIKLLEEVLEFNKTPKLNKFKKEYFINLKNNKEANNVY